MKSSTCLAALVAFFAAADAAPNAPWPTKDAWGSGWHEGAYPTAWPVPSWAKPCYSPTATGSASASASASSAVSATATASGSVAASSSATATAGGVSSVPTAIIKNGTVVGVKAVGYNQDYFLGVPYAQPPINDLRFRNPHSINSSFSGPYSATKISPECIGYGSDQWPYAISEDCLYLNIIRPANFSSYGKLPVALWIHGGGYSQGGNADERYNMSAIIQNGVEINRPFIAVQVNYRLSAWGFLFSDQIVGAGQTNIGLRDQRLALHWLQENIAAFGGDPQKVTIWGESAGASSVGFQLVAYGGRNDSIISGAIMESGNSVAYSPLLGTDVYQPRYNRIVNATGCSNAIDSLQCLRGVPFSTLNAAINSTGLNTTWFPTVDGDFIQRYTSLQLADGDFLKVPIIDGANSDEGISFGTRGLNTSAQFVAGLQNGSIRPGPALPAALSQQLADTYLALNICETPPLTLNTATGCAPAPASSGAIYRFTSAYSGDGVFIANRRLQCQTWAAAGIDAYCYRFNAQPAGNNIYSGVPHFQEIGFVFDNLAGLGYAPAAVNPFLGKPASYTALAKYISSSWASFINSGDPNGWQGQEAFGADDWPAYSVSTPENIVFDANVTGLAYAEPDTWRAAGIALINSANVAYQR